MDFTLEQLRASDRNAWNHAFECFYSLVMNVLRARGTPVAEADLEDVAMESISKLIDKYVESASSVEELKKLVVTIAKNHLNDLLAKRKAQIHGGGRVESIDDQPPDRDYASSSATPDEELGAIEVSLLIDDALNSIPEKHRDVLTDYFYLDLKEREIAEKRGLKIGSVGVYKARGIEALRPLLEDLKLL